MSRYRPVKSKIQHVRDCKDAIIAAYLGLDRPRTTVTALAEQYQVQRAELSKQMKQWRDEGLLPPISYGRWSVLEPDKDIIIQLYTEGMSLRELAEKWGVDKQSVMRALKRWGQDGRREGEYAGAPVDEISLSALQHCWADITEPVYVAVGRIPRFYLVPIGKGDNDD